MTDILGPTFSIITVCRNSAAHIETALRSVRDQSWPNIEHVVIDGGSTDETMEIVDRYRDRLATVVSEPDRGIYDAMNKGLAAATGDYVAFLNSDDVYADADVVRRVADVAAKEKYDAIFGDIAYVRGDAFNTIVRRFDSSRFSPAELANGWMMAHPALFMKRSVYEAVGGFDPTYRIAGDFDLIVRAFRTRELSYRYLKEVLTLMRLGGASTSGVHGRIKQAQEVMRACRDNGLLTTWPRLLARYPLKALEYLRR